MEHEPSLGQRKAGNVKLLDTISLAKYEPNQADVERILGIEDDVKRQKSSWLNLTQRSTNG